MKAKVDSLLDRYLKQSASNGLVILPQNITAPVDERDLDAKLIEDARKLIGDVAASLNDDSLWHCVETEYLIRGDAMLDALAGRHGWARARREEDKPSA